MKQGTLSSPKKVDRRHQLIRVRLRHTESELDAWWKTLSFDAKMRLFECNMAIPLKGIVR